MTFVRVVGLVAAAAAAGCGDGGPPLGRVGGTVTADGKPLANASVVFSPKAGGPKGGSSAGITDAAGRYALKFGTTRAGAVVGPHGVIVEHAEYANFGLTATVGEGDNTIDFRLGPGDRAGKGGRRKEDDAVPLEATK